MRNLRVLMDCDGPVADFTGYLLRLVGSSLTLADITDWDVFGFLEEEQKKEAYRILQESFFWRDLPVVDGARERIQEIKRAGHDIYWVTSSWPGCRTWASDREKWLKDNFDVHYTRIVVCADKRVVSGDVIIDDKMKSVESWGAEHKAGRALLFDAPYNQDSKLERIDWGSKFPAFLGG